MKYKSVLIIYFVFILISLTKSKLKEKKKIVCFYQNHAFHRDSYKKFAADEINPNLCTHIIYSYFGLSPEFEFVSKDSFIDFGDVDEDNDEVIGSIEKINQLKHINFELKTLAAIGGWLNEPYDRYSAMVKSSQNRKKFIQSALHFIKKHNFNGITMHWCYPNSSDRKNYAQLLNELKIEFQKHNLMVTVAVQYSHEQALESFDIPKLANAVDFIYLAAYDLYGPWLETRRIGMHSALFKNNIPGEENFNVDASVNFWLLSGTPSEKLILGVPLFGRAFTLRYTNSTDPGSIFIGEGRPVIVAYNVICQQIEKEKWAQKWSDIQKVPYTFKEDQWIGYENPKSVEIKAKYVADKGIGGIGASFIEDDDFRGLCGYEKYPLLKAINDILKPPQYVYQINVNVFKKNIRNGLTQVVYSNSEPLNLD